MPWTLLDQSDAGPLEVYRTVIEGAPVMLWLGDAEGKCVFLNHRQREFWGVPLDGLAGFDWAATLHPEDVAALAAPFREAMTKHTQMEVEARYRRADGVYRVLKTSASPRFDAAGTFLGMVGVNVDVTEQRQAEDDLRAARDALAHATQASHLGWGAWDLTTGEVTWDARAHEILDLRENENSLDDCLKRICEEDQDGIRAELRRCAEERQPFNMICRVLRQDGTERRVQGTGSIEFAPGGSPLRATGLVRDVTEQWREREFQRLVVGELNHRVKNLLGLVNALVSQTGTEGRTAEEFQAVLQGRLQALAATSGLPVDAATETIELRTLIETVLEPHRAEDRQDKFSILGDPLCLPLRKGRIVGLALHELATNAAKYGALSGPGGMVRLEWRTDRTEAQPRLILSWRESGGPGVVKPQRTGFGTLLLERVVALETNGSAEMHFDPSGLRYQLALPLDE